MKKSSAMMLLMVMGTLVLSGQHLWAQEDDGDDDELEVVSGVVDEIADDVTFVVVSGTKYTISAAVRDFVSMEPGDEVELYIEQTEDGPQVVDFDYL